MLFALAQPFRACLYWSFMNRFSYLFSSLKTISLVLAILLLMVLRPPWSSSYEYYFPYEYWLPLILKDCYCASLLMTTNTIFTQSTQKYGTNNSFLFMLNLMFASLYYKCRITHFFNHVCSWMLWAVSKDFTASLVISFMLMIGEGPVGPVRRLVPLPEKEQPGKMQCHHIGQRWKEMYCKGLWPFALWSNNLQKPWRR